MLHAWIFFPSLEESVMDAKSIVSVCKIKLHVSATS